jgi:SAM-dependent methyltransferase
MQKGNCIICGTVNDTWIYREILNGDLSSAWELSDEQVVKINMRESSFCSFCLNGARTRALAKGIMKAVNFPGAALFTDWISEANKRNYKVAEINSCNKLHDSLAKLDNLSFSEYHHDANSKVNDIPNENILHLTYPDNLFDVVLHSETLEHVPDFKKSLADCTRVLKPGGTCIYTVPVINGRATRKCIEISEAGDLVFLKPPSYHGLSDDFLVFWEFGDDYVELSESAIIYSEPEIFNYVFMIKKIQEEKNKTSRKDHV